MKKWIKRIGLVFLALFIFFVIYGWDESERSTNENLSLPQYEIIKSEDDKPNDDSVDRYVLDVVTEYPITKEEIQSITEKIVKDYEKDKPFNALTIFYYDYPEYIGWGYSLAKVEYSPNGNWGDALSTKKGDYRDFQYNYQYKPQIENIEAYKAKQPTIEDMVICGRAFELSTTEEYMMADDEEIVQAVAEEQNKTVEEVDQVWMKCAVW